MKKLVSILMIFTIAFSFTFCINVYADEAAPVTPKTEILLDRLESETEVSVTIRSGQTMLFGAIPADITNTFAAKGNNIAYEYSAGFLKARIVANESGVYGFSPTLPFFYAKMDTNPLAGANVWQLVMGAADLTQALTQYLGCRTETVDGVTYYVEKYDDREFVTSEFFYIGDELKMLRVEDSSTNSVQYTYFEDISFNVSDSFFTAPTAAIDLSPLLMSIFASLL